MADLGYQGKVRPVLILSTAPADTDRALLSYVIRTTSLRGTAYEVAHKARGMREGAFDAQGLGVTDRSRLLRRLGAADAATLGRVEQAVKTWLGLP